MVFPALIAPLPHVIGLAIVVGRVGAHERAAKVRENRRIRDEDQRAQFAEEERREERGPIRPAAPVRGGLRMACSECGELTDESELMFDDGVRRCASCAATS